jgi:hypothetical protein
MVRTSKAIGAGFDTGELVKWLVGGAAIIPLGRLAVFLHAAHGLAVDVSQPKDATEARNYGRYLELRGHLAPELLGPDISGSFKPDEFVHPFESHYSTPGYLDLSVLPKFFAVADARAATVRAKRDGCAFLAFVYVTFLLIHPFVERNGRVVRGILDYYNERLNLKLSGSWNEDDPKFAETSQHRRAFLDFFRGRQLRPLGEMPLSPIRRELRGELEKMADGLIEEIGRIARGGAFEEWPSVSRMSELIE